MPQGLFSHPTKFSKSTQWQCVIYAFGLAGALAVPAAAQDFTAAGTGDYRAAPSAVTANLAAKSPLTIQGAQDAPIAKRIALPLTEVEPGSSSAIAASRAVPASPPVVGTQPARLSALNPNFDRSRAGQAPGQNAAVDLFRLKPPLGLSPAPGLGTVQANGGALPSSATSLSPTSRAAAASDSLSFAAGTGFAPPPAIAAYRPEPEFNPLQPTVIERKLGRGIAKFGPGSIVRYNISPKSAPAVDFEYQLAMTQTPYYERRAGANPYQLVVGAKLRF